MTRMWAVHQQGTRRKLGVVREVPNGSPPEDGAVRIYGRAIYLILVDDWYRNHYRNSRNRILPKEHVK
jgi:hypothetical protein